MIPYDIDPSLHTAEPEPEVLDDGFSPRPHEEPAAAVQPESADAAAAAAARQEVLRGKSPF